MISKKISKAFQYIKQFGLLFSIKCAYYRALKKNDKYIKLLSNYLAADNAEVLQKYNKHRRSKKLSSDELYVWVCWWQGYDKMPALCKMLFNRLQEMLPSEAKLILITHENYLEYASIPEYIREKYEKGLITMTTYSDILRNYLLRDNGGLWIDSSVFISKKITKEFLSSKEWWSINTRDDKSKIENLGQMISRRRWSGFLQKGVKGNLLNSYLCDSFEKYYKNHNYLIDYFIQNLYIKVAYDNIPEIKEMIDNIPRNNVNVYSLYDIIDDKYSDDKYKELTENTTFFKLTQKRNYCINDCDGDLTYYGAIEKICNNKK